MFHFLTSPSKLSIYFSCSKFPFKKIFILFLPMSSFLGLNFAFIVKKSTGWITLFLYSNEVQLQEGDILINVTGVSPTLTILKS